jgi:L-fuculose-phosphate aldolase
MDESQARKLIVEVGKLLYDRGHVVAFDGNISIRLDENTVLATPTQMSKGRLTEESLALTNLEGKPLSDKRASSELAMHLLIYKMRPDIHAVCHAHPPHGTAFSVAGLAIDRPILSEVVLTLGCVPLTAYGTPSTDELTEAMKPFVPHHNALLMANHGAVAYGKHLWEAFDRLETLEHTAKIAILAKTLGGANDLPAGSIEKLIEIREKAGFLGPDARCQACGYLHEAQIACDLDVNYPTETNGNGRKIAFTREELIDLLSQAAKLG